MLLGALLFGLVLQRGARCEPPGEEQRPVGHGQESLGEWRGRVGNDVSANDSGAASTDGKSGRQNGEAGVGAEAEARRLAEERAASEAAAKQRARLRQETEAAAAKARARDEAAERVRREEAARERESSEAREREQREQEARDKVVEAQRRAVEAQAKAKQVMPWQPTSCSGVFRALLPLTSSSFEHSHRADIGTSSANSSNVAESPPPPPLPHTHTYYLLPSLPLPSPLSLSLSHTHTLSLARSLTHKHTRKSCVAGVCGGEDGRVGAGILAQSRLAVPSRWFRLMVMRGVQIRRGQPPWRQPRGKS